MNKNTIIRVDTNNIIYLALDTETHEGYGGILDPESGVWYEISTVVNPTKSTVVRFDDTNVVIIKLDPDTHDSAAIVVDEINGNVYPINDTPSLGYAVEYQGNFTTTTPSNTRVTLFTDEITLQYGEVLKVEAETGFKIYAVNEVGAGEDTSLSRTAKRSNAVYVYGVNNATSYVYTTSDNVCGNSTAYKIKASSNTWTQNISYAIQNAAITSLTFDGICFYVEKSDSSAISIDEAKAAISITIE